MSWVARDDGSHKLEGDAAQAGLNEAAGRERDGYGDRGRSRFLDHGTTADAATVLAPTVTSVESTDGAADASPHTGTARWATVGATLPITIAVREGDTAAQH